MYDFTEAMYILYSKQFYYQRLTLINNALRGRCWFVDPDRVPVTAMQASRCHDARGPNLFPTNHHITSDDTIHRLMTCRFLRALITFGYHLGFLRHRHFLCKAARRARAIATRSCRRASTEEHGATHRQSSRIAFD